MDAVLNFLKKYAIYIVGGLLLLGFLSYYLYEEVSAPKKMSYARSMANYPNPSGITDSDFNYENLSTATTRNDTDMQYPSDKYNRIDTADGQVVYTPTMAFDSVDILGQEEFDRVIDGITPGISPSQLEQLTTPWIVRQFQDNFFGTYWPGDLDTCNGNKFCIEKKHTRPGIFNTDCNR
jgi:hypothetical protein